MENTQGRTTSRQTKLPGPIQESSTAPLTQLATIVPPGTQKARFRRLWRGLLFAGVAAGSALVGLASALMLPIPAKIANDQGPESFGELIQYGFQYRVARPVNILVMGIDRVLDAPAGSAKVFEGRSDTMLLLRVDPGSDSVSMLSIPRDTQVELPGTSIITKINDANVRGGPRLAADTVQSILNGVEIDRYVRVSTNAFRELVDLMGGVEVYVPERMSYEDKTQKLKIDLSPGLQTLTGDQAEQFARFRYDSYGDIGRVQRQQALLKALLKKLTSPAAIPRLPALLGSMQKYIDTNLSLEEMLALTGVGRKLSQGNFKMVMLPGRFSAPGEFRASYWIMNPTGRDRVMQQYFDVQPVSAANQEFQAATALKIAIQNASDQPNVAQEMRTYLTKLGFQNVYIADDWPDKQAETQIVVQQGDLSGANDLQKALGFGKIEAASTGDLESDLTIRVGNDWHQPAQPK